MVKGQNWNRPQQGDQIKVEPIRRKKDIENIKKLLAANARDAALFTLGINTNLRASDLLRIRAGQVRDLKPGDSIQLKEKKTGKFPDGHSQQGLHPGHPETAGIKVLCR